MANQKAAEGVTMKKVLFYLIMFCVTLTLMVVLSELLLRLTGNGPWTYDVRRPNAPTIHDRDPVFGWRNREGSYVFSPYAESGEKFHMTFLPGGRRAAGSGESAAKDAILLVGGSYMQGWAISDHDTCAWKLQQKYPSLNVLNYGTDGYGTYQSLLVLERELPLLPSPLLVLYGFMEHHETRNVAPARWLRSLSEFSGTEDVYIPYVTLDLQKSLVRHPPERYMVTPWRESLALMNHLGKKYATLLTKDRDAQKSEVTEKILLEMNRLSEARGARFAVVLFSASEKTRDHYMRYLTARDIIVIDCIYPDSPDMTVPGEGHPNGRKNSLWAECISSDNGIRAALGH